MRGNVEAIKERLDIAEVVGSYITLQKAGVNFKAKCPFHNEKTPSFLVSTARQSYYCFGCGEKGDIFTFVEKMEGVDFKSALKTLAEKAGVELVYEKSENKDEKDKLYAVLEDATLFFEKNLKENKDAQDYLASRGISLETIQKWRLGFAPEEWRLLFNHLKSIGYDESVILRAGLVKRPDDSSGKEPYDVFRGRLIFPLFDMSGKVIAFSGRALAKDAVPKYLNSPDTPLFTKSEVLYGLDKAKDEIRKKDYAVLVEGQMDLVLSHQAGVRNTVASSGTAFTQRHIERLKKWSPQSPQMTLAFDADTAGEKATEKSIILGFSMGMQVKVAKLPNGKDPADIIREDPKEWRKILSSTKYAVDHVLEIILREESDSRKVRRDIEKKLLPMVKCMQNMIDQDFALNFISRRTAINYNILKDSLNKISVPKLSPIGDMEENPTQKSEEKVLTPSIKELIEERLLWIQESLEPSEKEVLELRQRLLIVKLEEERMILRAKGDKESSIERISEIDRLIDEEKRKIAQ